MSALVSVVIPCYNMRSYIAETIQSVANQTCQDIEILVVDDGSTDDSALVAGSFPDSRVRILTKPNGGLASARNFGVSHSSAPLILPLDADDKLDPEYLSRTLKYMSSGVGVVATWMEIFGEHTELCGSPTSTYPIFSPTVESILKGNNLPCCSLIKKEALNQVGGWPDTPKGSEDWALWARIVCKTSWRVEVLEHYLFKYRVRPNSMRSTMQPFEITREEIRKQNA